MTVVNAEYINHTEMQVRGQEEHYIYKCKKLFAEYEMEMGDRNKDVGNRQRRASRLQQRQQGTAGFC